MATLARLKNAYINNRVVFYRSPAGTPVQGPALDAPWPLRQVESYSRRWEYGSIICSELEKGSVAYVVAMNGTVAHYSFVTSEPLHIAEVRRRVRLPRNSIAIYNCYTSAPYRRRGVFACTLRAICACNATKDKYIYALEHNLPSRSAIDKVGFTEIGRMQFRRLGLLESFENDTNIDIVAG